MKKAVFITLILLNCLQGFGQYNLSLDPNKRLSQYVLRHFSAEQGLGSESVGDICQTPDGYIWIATYGGLVRFDGKKFFLFNANNSKLPSSNTMQVAEDKSGKLWIGTLHGVAIYENGVISLPQELDSLSKYSIEELYVTEKNDLWISTKSGHVFFYNGKVLQDFTAKFNTNKSIIQTFYETPDGALWLGTGSSLLVKLKDGVVSNYTFPENVNGVYSFDFIENKLWIATGKGVYVCENDCEIRKVEIFGDLGATDILHDMSNDVWVGSLTGVFRLSHAKKSLDVLNEQNGLPNNVIQKLFVDNQGNLWGGTYRSGMFQLIDGIFTGFSSTEGLPSNTIVSIAQLDENTIITGEENGNLNLIINGIVSAYKPAIPIPKQRLKHVFVDSKKQIWVSTYAGLIRLSGASSKIFSGAVGFPDDLVRLTFEDSEGNIWIGTKNAGIIKFVSDREWKIISTSQGMSSNYIMDIAQDENKNLIVGTINGTNFLRGDSVFKTLTIENGLPSNFAFKVIPEKNNLWIVGNDGLIYITPEKVSVINTNQGLPFNSLYDFQEDNLGYIWIPGEKAVLRVEKQQLLDYFEGKIKTVKPKIFGRTDGLKNSQCIGASKSFTDTQGNIWIPTQGGLARVTPSETGTISIKPKILVEGIITGTDTLLAKSAYEIPPGTNRFTLYFTAFDYKAPEKLSFRYKLKPYDKTWIPATGERTAVYTNIQPGSYTFIVEAFNGEEWFELDKEIAVEIVPAWYQSWLFRISVLLVFLLSGAGFYQFRMYQIRQRNLFLERTVQQRTAEVEQQKAELMLQSANLMQANEEITAKNDELVLTNEQIHKQSTIIERQNDHVHQSIRYALSIQTAILPNDNAFDDLFNKFILFKPKDVVSGDFYWFAREREINGKLKSYAAVVDCTGHGVPGAFMAMLGYQSLNTIVFDKRITNPAEILEALSVEITTILHQTENDNRDGMDVCLCSFERLPNGKLLVEYSGAKRPLYVFNKKRKTIAAYEGTRRAIGGNLRSNAKVPFLSYSFEIDSDSILYLCSDGFIHQPDSSRKAMGSVNFLDLISNFGIYELAMQKEMFEKALEKYRGHSPQRDDITLIAINPK